MNITTGGRNSARGLNHLRNYLTELSLQVVGENSDKKCYIIMVNNETEVTTILNTINKQIGEKTYKQLYDRKNELLYIMF